LSALTQDRSLSIKARIVTATDAARGILAEMETGWSMSPEWLEGDLE